MALPSAPPVENQAAAVEQFKEVCAVDEAKAIEYLQHCEGNLEEAVQLYFVTGGSLENSREAEQNHANVERELRHRRRHSSSSSEASVATARLLANAIRQRENPGSALARPAPTWSGWLWALLTFPVQLTVSALWEVIGFISSVLLERPPPAVTDARGDVRAWLDEYRDKYGAGAGEHAVQWMTGSYNEAVREAKSSLRMLIVYVHGPGVRGIDEFVSSSLHSAAFSSLVSQNELLVWGASTASPEGKHVAMQMRARTFPLVALVAQRDGRMLTMTRVEGVLPASQLVAILRPHIDMHKGHLNVLRMQRAQLQEDSRLRAEQEREYQVSVAADRARMAERRRLESEKADKEARQRRLAEERQHRKQELDSRRAALAESPLADSPHPQAYRVRVTYPNGAKQERRFAPDDSMESLFSSVFSHPACPDYFSLFTAYPRKQIHCAPQWYHDLSTQHIVGTAEEEGSEPGELPAFVAAETFVSSGVERALALMVQNNDA